MIVRKAIDENLTLIQYTEDIIKLIPILDIGTKQSLHMAAYETINGKLPYDISAVKQSIVDLYKILMNFFLIAQKPDYTYQELLQIIGTNDNWRMMTMVLIGTFLGFDTILAQNPDIANELIKFTENKFDSMVLLP
jgi:hypothetical protein